MKDPQDSVVVDDRKQFKLDRVFDDQASQDLVYTTVAQPLVQGFLHGYNACILAYGQTNSGKTYTMGAAGPVVPDRTGIIPRAVRDVFRHLEGSDNESASPRKVSVSLIEIYNEDVLDLFALPPRPVTLREDPSGAIVWCGATERRAVDATDALKMLSTGLERRQTHATHSNKESSRSHVIFSLQLVQTATTSRFCFVDLAGSERLKRTNAEGDRKREGIFINQGLLALGNVIGALCGEFPAPHLNGHVPYRDSKLTRVLQESLGGNSRTAMIACIGTGADDLGETLNTLGWASRGRRICNTSLRNVSPVPGADLAALQAELARLRSLLATANATGSVPRSFVVDWGYVN
ncbi:Chromosome-associated kinesin kif4a [Thoreauomyces humboldtii]|nr:Chromosome-associated kinesin kif4a [Thoreauomyces humboldtii]